MATLHKLIRKNDIKNWNIYQNVVMLPYYIMNKCKIIKHINTYKN